LSWQLRDEVFREASSPKARVDLIFLSLVGRKLARSKLSEGIHQ
jgi:hypothetical protein